MSYSWFLALVFACEDCIGVQKDKPTWKPELSLGEKQAIWSLEMNGNQAIAKALGIACTTTWHVLKKKETCWHTEKQTIEQVNQGEKKQQQLMTETLWELWRKPTDILGSITSANLHQGRGEDRISIIPVQRRLVSSSQYRGYTTWWKTLIRSNNRKTEITICKKVQRGATKVLWNRWDQD